MANKAYRFRIYPNNEQSAFLAKCFGCSRFVYNHCLRITTDFYAQSKKSLRYKEWAKLLVSLKSEFEWLPEVYSQSLQQTFKDLKSALTWVFQKLGGFPNFQTRSDRQSFRYHKTFQYMRKAISAESRNINGMLKSRKL
ncbi:RNA-guided endonuclease InsQ/TnpB family protein [Nostoc sp. CCY 9925]|uniref:RNA-guided endonuclease InsQ/TnpB family protein n=1 Tax=Nostoc sp. CCY 9925 TaxID=3103865 RepID=UPI0039C6950B